MPGDYELKAPLRNLSEWLRRIGVSDAISRGLRYSAGIQPVEIVADASGLTSALLPAMASVGSSPLTLAAQFGQWKLQSGGRWIRVRKLTIGGLAASTGGYKMVVQPLDAALATSGHIDNMGGPEAGNVLANFSYGGAGAASLVVTNLAGFVSSNNFSVDAHDHFWIRPQEQLFIETFAALTADIFCAIRFDEVPVRE